MRDWDQSFCTLRAGHTWSGSVAHTIEVRLESTSPNEVDVNVRAVVLDPLE